MKSLDEVIKAYEYCDHGEPDSRCEDCPYDGIGVCCAERESDALHYLKEYQRDCEDLVEAAKSLTKKEHEQALTDRNDPLTWDELRQMEGKPVWVEYNFQIGNKEFRDKSKRWCIVREIELWDDTEIIITENGFILSKREQIKDWQAYRKERNEES